MERTRACRRFSPSPPRYLDARCGSVPYGAGRTRVPCAAPLPNLARTGARGPGRHLLASAGTRGQRGFSSAEDLAKVSRYSPSPWRQRLHTCVVPRHALCTALVTYSQDTRPGADGADTDKARKNGKNPLLGRVCLLTRGILIRVRPGKPFSLARLSHTTYSRTLMRFSSTIHSRCARGSCDNSGITRTNTSKTCGLS
jgi:hypothetical protein